MATETATAPAATTNGTSKETVNVAPTPSAWYPKALIPPSQPPSATNPFHAKLDTLYDVWESLRPTSTPADFAKFGSFFSENCSAWLLSMREWAEPSLGRDAVITFVTQNSQIYHFERPREVMSRSTSDDGCTVTVEMKTTLNVMGKSMENNFETAVARFGKESGLIEEFKVYCCRSHIMLIVQAMTGVGPYSEKFQEEEWEIFTGKKEMQPTGATGIAAILDVVNASCCRP